jgi:hypothetical protein
MSDDDINGLAHELWSLAQGVAPISDRIDLMIPELQKFSASVRAAERERCARAALRRSRGTPTPSGAVALQNFANELRAGAKP